MRTAFPIEVVLSLTTGILLCKFSDMHEMIEHVAGRSVWTHELASKAFVENLTHTVFDQQPQLREAEKFVRPNLGGEKAVLNYIKGYVERAQAKFGEEITLNKGTGEEVDSPFESLHMMKG